MSDAAPRVVLVTAPDADCARRLAEALVGERLAACANLLPGVTSIYRWEGAVEEATEVLLILKTRAGLVPEIEARLVDLHPYDVPECVAIAPDRVGAPYLAWLQGMTE